MGEVSETVEIVGAAGETVNTTSGEVSRVIDQQQVQNLAATCWSSMEAGWAVENQARRG